MTSDAGSTSILSVTGLTAGYGQSQILTDVTFGLAAGDAVCLLGRNGVGKTTLVKSVVGLIKPREGQIAIDGTDVTGSPPHRRARMGLGYVPQGRGIFGHLSVFENLLMGFESRTSRAADRAETIEELYGLFPVLAEMRHRIAGTLSGGQLQQLAIARSLAGRPRILILDEPTEGIQPSIVDHIESVLVRLREQGLTILLVEQFLDFAVGVCDRFHMLERGVIVASGATEDLTDAMVDEFLAV
ncbi:MAG: urea ABC transporter ATP-binding subunit UrtE [Chloroflexota bacterium]